MLKIIKLSKISRLSYQFFIYLAGIILILANVVWLIPSLQKIKIDAALLQLETAYRAKDIVSHFVEWQIEDSERITGLIAAREDKKQFLDFILKNPNVQQVAFIDKSGKEIFKIHRYRRISSGDLKDRVSEKGVRQALLTGENYLGQVFTENLEPVLNIIIPVKSSESEIIGALEINLNLRNLWKIIGELKVGERGFVYVVNTNGIIIAHRDPDVVLTGSYVLDKKIARTLIFEKKLVNGLGDESRYFDVQGQEVFGVGVPLSAFGWGVIAEQPQKDAFSARSQIIILAGATLGIGFILLFLLQLISSRLIRATSLLAEEKQRVEELSRVLEVKVKARTKELEEEKISLERKIQDRTKELQERITDLERFSKLTVGRELKMLELKEEIEKLKKELEKNPPPLSPSRKLRKIRRK